MSMHSTPLIISALHHITMEPTKKLHHGKRKSKIYLRGGHKGMKLFIDGSRLPVENHECCSLFTFYTTQLRFRKTLFYCYTTFDIVHEDRRYTNTNAGKYVVNTYFTYIQCYSATVDVVYFNHYFR